MAAFLRSRVALVGFAAAALTAFGCSLLVEFDESSIPVEPAAETGAETSVIDTGTPPMDSGTPVDTAIDDTAMPDTAMPPADAGDTGMAADTADTAPLPDTEPLPDTAPLPDTEPLPDTADTATGDTNIDDAADTL